MRSGDGPFARGAPRFVWLAGLAAGALDILYAIVFWRAKANVPPQRILQSVAGGLLGKASFTGGWATAFLGLVLHFFIALSMAFVYYGVARRWAPLRDRPFSLGAVYGLVLYLIMNLIVVPVSKASPGSRDPLWIVLSVAVHMFGIGVPIALGSRRALQR